MTQERATVLRPGRERLLGIDLLRGLAVALVMARHAFPDVFPGAGVVGVVMFFALSGHLITHGLVVEHARAGRIALGRFYRRRAVRLVPALLFLLAGFSAVVLVWDPLDDRALLPGTWVRALTWTANLPVGPEASEAAFHLWTLAGEEQFYLVWPLLLMWVLPRRWLWQMVVTLLVLSAVGIGVTALWLGDEADLAYALPTSWFACFVIGGASALVPQQVRTRLCGSPVRRGVVVAALATVLLGAVLEVRGAWGTYLWVGPLVAVMTSLLVWAARAQHEPRGVPSPSPTSPIPTSPIPASPVPASRLLSVLFTAGVWLGQRSYAAYLWNYPIALWLRESSLSMSSQGVLGLLLTCLMAEVSWRLVELPVARIAARPRGRDAPWEHQA